jgi:hypothetical protein
MSKFVVLVTGIAALVAGAALLELNDATVGSMSNATAAVSKS